MLRLEEKCVFENRELVSTGQKSLVLYSVNRTLIFNGLLTMFTYFLPTLFINCLYVIILKQTFMSQQKHEWTSHYANF